MKNIKKRLPALLLALVIAVMPLMLAVPVSASSDALAGGQSDPVLCLPYGSESPLFLPLPAAWFANLTDMQVLIAYTGNTFKLYNFYAGTITGGTVSSSYISVQFKGSYSTYTFIDGSWVYDGADSSSSTVHIDCVAYGDARYWSNRSLGLSNQGQNPGYFFTSIPGTSVLGIFTVFSGVGSWLTGAIGNAASVFWTAEGGLTVLGVLALASLAIALVILIVYLLAGWLRFK